MFRKFEVYKQNDPAKGTQEVLINTRHIMLVDSAEVEGNIKGVMKPCTVLIMVTGAMFTMPIEYEHVAAELDRAAYH